MLFFCTSVVGPLRAWEIPYTLKAWEIAIHPKGLGDPLHSKGLGNDGSATRGGEAEDRGALSLTALEG